jgi:hypothetical protein
VDIQEIKETPVWALYEKGRNYHRRTDIYTDTDRNYRMYNGDQWGGAKLGDVEPVQKNFIKPIVKYKVSVIHDNLYAVNFSSQNYENRQFQKEASRYCDLLNGYIRRLWENDKLDFYGRRVTKDAAINSEGIMYIDFDQEKMTPVHEIIKKNDVYYGNENDDNIQAQPYILIRKRMPVSNAIELALNKGMSEAKTEFIIGDNDNFEESGEAAKIELDNMVTIVYKMYKKDGTVHYSVATRWCDIVEDVDTGLTHYPLAHFVWEEKEGSARGEGEVKWLIPNQIEVNRTEMRRVLTVKEQAYPMKVIDVSKVTNPEAINTVGGTIRTNGQPVDDVHKIVGTIPPAQMSADVKQLQEDLIQVTRELAGAGDTATGQVNPESASGRAILAVQQASQAPMTEQKEAYKNFIEDIATIDLEYFVVYAENGVDMEETVTDPYTGEEYVQMVNVPQTVLQQLQAVVKIDITPKGVYDRFAMEQTMENFLMNGFFNPQRVAEFESYVKALPDDSVAPKQDLLEGIENIKKTQQQIAQINSETQIALQKAQRFLMNDPDGQAQQMVDARRKLQEQQFLNKEKNLDSKVAEEAENVDRASV